MHKKKKDKITDGSQNYTKCPKDSLEKPKVNQRWPLLILSVCDIPKDPCTLDILSIVLYWFLLNMFIGKDSRKKEKQD